MNYKTAQRQRRASHSAQSAWNSTMGYIGTPQNATAPAPIIVETHAIQEQYYADLAHNLYNDFGANDSPLRFVPLHEVIATPNYRDEYEQEFIDTIASNMARHGFDPAHAIEVYATPEGYPIIDGNTRNKAALQGSTYDLESHEPLMMVWVCIKPKPTNDADLALSQFQANHNRRAAGEVSDAKAFKRMLDGGKTYAEIKTMTGLDRNYIDRRLALLTLLPEIQEFVARKQLGISFAYAMRDLDSNRQRIALRAYNAKKPLLDEFISLCSKLLEDQTREDTANMLFDISALESKANEQLVSIMVESRKSRADLEKELNDTKSILIAEKQARKADQVWAISKVKQLQAENARLMALVNNGKVA